MLNLEEIKDHVIETGYNELQQINIEISWHSVSGGLVTYGDLYIPQNNGFNHIGYYIYIHPLLKKAGKAEIRGGIAHENVHLLRDIRQSRKQAEEEVRIYYHSKSYRIRDEICTDLEAINRGFGKEILALEIFREDSLSHNGFGIPSAYLKEILATMQDFPGRFTYKDYINMFGNGR